MSDTLYVTVGTLHGQKCACDWKDKCKSKVAPQYSSFKNKAAKPLLWVAGLYDPFWDGKKLRGVLLHSLNGKEVTDFVAIVRACGKNKDLCRGIGVHDAISRKGLVEKCSDALVTMYVKCGLLAKAKELFQSHKSRDVFTWNTVIAGYVQKGQGHSALDYYEQMQQHGLSPDVVTFTCILKACGIIGAVKKGGQIHDEIAKQGLLGNDIVLGTALVSMYAKCGALTKAQRVLEELPVRNVISWNALIAGYAQHCEGEQALNCYGKMRREGLSPDEVTLISVLTACGSIGAADEGEKVHEEIAKQGLLCNNTALGNALVDMYVKCGGLAKARQALEALPVRNVISWSALIAGYAQQGEGEQALNCFEQMQREGLCPNAVTFICILKACGTIGAAEKGGEIHDEIAKQGLLKNDAVLATALVGMYAKCGALSKARQVLEELPVRNVISWNALIAGSVQQGEGQNALECFELMQQEGLSPDAATISCVLSACSRLGLLQDAQTYFVNISTKYGMRPVLEHYTCMIDLFGRAGHLKKAVEIIEKMPAFDSGVWSALLGACQKWGDVNVGKWAFEHALLVDQSDSAFYVVMANIYAAAGMQEDAEKVDAMRRENNARRRPGQSRWADMFGRCSFQGTQQMHIEKLDSCIKPLEVYYPNSP